MKYYLCIDDTDNLDSIGTGTIAEQIQELLGENDISNCSLITRHQLFIHPDIPYTSHNSSMCFSFEAEKSAYSNIINLASNYLANTAAEGSDPGLCILPFDEAADYSPLIDYGKTAKSKVLSKQSAYDCAAKLDIHLSEHGGTGDGVIGALAGIGLRLSGCDGEIKAGLKNFKTGTFTVSEMKGLPEIDTVIDYHSKTALCDTVSVSVNQRSKTVFYNNQYVLFVQKNAGQEYQVFGKSEIRKMGDNFYE